MSLLLWNGKNGAGVAQQGARKRQQQQIPQEGLWQRAEISPAKTAARDVEPDGDAIAQHRNKQGKQPDHQPESPAPVGDHREPGAELQRDKPPDGKGNERRPEQAEGADLLGEQLRRR